MYFSEGLGKLWLASQSEHEFIINIILFFLFQGVKHFDFIPESYIIPEEFNEFNGAWF